MILRTDPSPCELPLHNLLLNCLSSGDSQQWEALVGRLQPVFARIAYRIARETSVATPGDVDDVIQECFLKLGAGRNKLCSQSSQFDCEEAALAYLKVVAANTARDYFRRKSAEKRSSAKTTSVEDRLTEIATGDTASVDRGVLIRQIDVLLGSDAKERAIFWLYYRQGFTAKEISDIPKFHLSPKGVESLLRRLTLTIRKQLDEGFSGREAS